MRGTLYTKAGSELDSAGSKLVVSAGNTGTLVEEGLLLAQITERHAS